MARGHESCLVFRVQVVLEARVRRGSAETVLVVEDILHSPPRLCYPVEKCAQGGLSSLFSSSRVRALVPLPWGREPPP